MPRAGSRADAARAHAAPATGGFAARARKLARGVTCNLAVTRLSQRRPATSNTRTRPTEDRCVSAARAHADSAAGLVARARRLGQGVACRVAAARLNLQRTVNSKTHAAPTEGSAGAARALVAPASGLTAHARGLCEGVAC